MAKEPWMPEHINIYKYRDGTWAVVKIGEKQTYYDEPTCETLFRAGTRKECRQYCEYNGLEIHRMDTGREFLYGCKW